MHSFQFTKAKLKILCLGAHPDDIEIGCGGTILKLTELHDTHVTWVVFSANAERKKEAIESANAFLKKSSAKTIIVNNFDETYFPYDGKKVKQYFFELYPLNPDIVFTHAQGDSHQDHKLINELTWNTFRDHLILEYEIPKYDGDLGNPHIYSILSREICEKKIEIITTVFLSQVNRNWFDMETFWALLRLRGVESNSITKYAEAFYARKIVIQ
jgi:LmbE family N-acetylglucosaminyl deacetylase